MAIRWYCTYALSYREIEELMLERGIKIDHTTLNRWVVEFSPLLLTEFRKKKRAIGKSWHVDETYIKLKGKWGYQYRALDHQGNTIDCLFSEKRNKKSAMKFFKKCMKNSGNPLMINLDKNPANNAALKSFNETLKNKITVRNKTYLNNIIEQDHRFIKKLTRPTKGFKSFYSASTTLKGIELCHMIKKGQLKYHASKPTFAQFYALAA